MKMINETLKNLRDFITDDQILEVLIEMEEHGKMSAARLLSTYMYPKWEITTLDAVKILNKIENF